jgi:hypothetical protein
VARCGSPLINQYSRNGEWYEGQITLSELLEKLPHFELARLYQANPTLPGNLALCPAPSGPPYNGTDHDHHDRKKRVYQSGLFSIIGIRFLHRFSPVRASILTARIASLGCIDGGRKPGRGRETWLATCVNTAKISITAQTDAIRGFSRRNGSGRRRWPKNIANSTYYGCRDERDSPGRGSWHSLLRRVNVAHKKSMKLNFFAVDRSFLRSRSAQELNK